MTNSKTNAFRKRFTEIDGGLKIEEKPKPALMPVLKTDHSIDLSKLESFTASSVDMKGIAERIKPQGMGDLRVDTDLSKLNDGIEKVKRQQSNDKIRSLVEEAERSIDRKQYRSAIRALNQALEIDDTSAQVLFLKGYCFFSLGEYKDALQVLEEARRYVGAAELMMTILMLLEACRRAAAACFEDQLLELMESGRTAQALSLIEGELRDDPSNALLLYYLCGVLLVLGRVREAKQKAAAAMISVDVENVPLFQELHDQIVFQENEKYLEAARLALRRGDPSQALHQLQICHTALAGNEQYEILKSYAEEKNSRGLFRALFSRNRPAAVTEDARQRLLLWLLGEEVDAGSAALNARKFDVAVSIFEKAAKIDGTCSIVCFLHGTAIFDGFRDAVEQQKDLPDLDSSIRRLEQAIPLLRHASADPLTAEQGKLFLTLVNNVIQQLQEIKRQIVRRSAESKPVNDLIHEFNSLMDSLEKGIDSAKDLDRAENQLRALRKKAEKLCKGRTKEQGIEILQQIIDTVDDNLRQIDALRGEVSQMQLVNECVEDFTQMMDYFTKFPISSQRELQAARDRVAKIKTKITKAKTKVKQGTEAWRVLGQVEEAVRKAANQIY